MFSMFQWVSMLHGDATIACMLTIKVEGTEIWVTAENAYNERVARVENQIIARLRDRLGTARNANEMFRVFSKFNSLFVRPKVGPSCCLDINSGAHEGLLDSRSHPGVPNTAHRLRQGRHQASARQGKHMTTQDDVGFLTSFL